MLFMFAIALYSVADVLSSDDQRRGGAPKFMWVLITVCIPILGPVVWLVFVSARKSAVNQQPGAQGSSTPYYGYRTSGSRSGAPDDDPEFLWRLAAEQRRKREAEERRNQEPNTPDQDEGDEPNPKSTDPK